MRQGKGLRGYLSEYAGARYGRPDEGAPELHILPEDKGELLNGLVHRLARHTLHLSWRIGKHQERGGREGTALMALCEGGPLRLQ